MTGKVAPRRAAAKSDHCPKGNPKVARPVENSPVMQRVRVSLGGNKPSAKLHFLTGQPLSICQKTLAGNRLPNAAMIEALFADELIIDAILGLIPDTATHPKVRAVRKAIRRLELDFEDAEDDR
jgi:hypothetical protein